MGDPVGIGPEIVAKALCEPCVSRLCRPIVYGNAVRLIKGARCAGAKIDFVAVPSVNEARRSHADVAVIDPGRSNDAAGLDWARPTAACGLAMFAYLNAAIDDAMAGKVDAIATGPINKAALHMAGIAYAGHTEILAHRTQTRNYAMMLAGDRLKVVLATIHVPLARVPEILATSTILKVIELTGHDLKTRFGISDARIAVAGLNPHAGENGLFGDEEEKIIRPAIDQAISRGIDASGPHPPDTVFFSASRGAYDAVIAMYHDQGLGPFKMIHFNDGVNTTLGLPIVRTSVDHGTAYDIAGTGRASAESMVAAIAMAAKQAEWLRRHRSYIAESNSLRS
ncbi:4-hydroxythreonine-4-phosphate dehydrogenase [Desulfosarcina widdelii]|uniref:4-hydroxythreonine-4-phosphate dehydrogenase n=2 Tax=Desulfosarcina widdelii TaxID=947919 RepID=A0A5K7ZEU3_9BACT|nr:4-hydroxythreonine-4-phosphate dehydrogenase [Desulfosarcina widdelii]